MSNKINIYCAWYRNTIIKYKPQLIKSIFLEIPCLECNGSGMFDCEIEEQIGMCICCKGTRKQYVGTI